MRPPMRAVESVFVSHSRKDLRTKKAVENGLAKVGLRPVYYEGIVTYRTSTTAINNLIRRAIGFFVFVTEYSTSAVTRDWICFEIGLAKAHRKHIYSWKAGKVPREDMPVFMRLLSNPKEYTTKTTEGIENLE